MSKRRFIRAIYTCLFASGLSVSYAGSVVVQEAPGILNAVSFSGSSASLTSIGGAGVEYNNMGWSSADGNLYAVELTGSGFGAGQNGIVRIDPTTGLATNLGNPSGLPTGVATRFDAGDVYGNTMWITFGSVSSSALYASNIYTLDLSSVTNGSNDISGASVSTTGITGASVQVNDWAYNPLDGLLYGGDKLTGNIATLNPTTGERSTFSVGLTDEEKAFGAAWYDPVLQNIFLYRNDGPIIQIDPSDKSLIKSWAASSTSYNDGAYVGVVPIPAAVWLFGSAMGLMGFAGWKREKTA